MIEVSPKTVGPVTLATMIPGFLSIYVNPAALDFDFAGIVEDYYPFKFASSSIGCFIIKPPPPGAYSCPNAELVPFIFSLESFA